MSAVYVSNIRCKPREGDIEFGYKLGSLTRFFEYVGHSLLIILRTFSKLTSFIKMYRHFYILL